MRKQLFLGACLPFAVALSVHCSEPVDGSAPGASEPTPDASVDPAPELDGSIADAATDDAAADVAVPSTPRFAPNDVSVLFPLTPESNTDLLSPSDVGTGGPLLPRRAFGQMDGEFLTRSFDPGDPTYNALRVVGFRYDPCFVSVPGGTCQPQLRLVLQALEPGDPGQLVAADGAIHLMFNLSAADAVGAASDLRALVPLAPENRDVAALQVSPALHAQGVRGAYGSALRAYILRYAGERTLARMTFMTRELARQGTWVFGGFKLADYPHTTGAEGPITIFGVDAKKQTVSNMLPAAKEVAYIVDPEFADPVGRPGASNMHFEGFAPNGAEHTALAGWMNRQQDGAGLVTPDTSDCASCHLADHIRTAVETKLGARTGATITGEKLPSAADAFQDNLRAFGYFFDSPAISARAANETAAIVNAQ